MTGIGCSANHRHPLIFGLAVSATRLGRRGSAGGAGGELFAVCGGLAVADAEASLRAPGDV